MLLKDYIVFSNVAVQMAPLESGKGFSMTLEISDVMFRMCEQDAWDSDGGKNQINRRKQAIESAVCVSLLSICPWTIRTLSIFWPVNTDCVHF